MGKVFKCVKAQRIQRGIIMQINDDLKAKILEGVDKMMDEMFKITTPQVYSEMENLLGNFLNDLGLI